MRDAIRTADVDSDMHAWVRWCSNPKSTDVVNAVLAGLLVPGTVESGHNYVCTKTGREWLIANAISNGSTREEAEMCLDYLDGAY